MVDEPVLMVPKLYVNFPTCLLRVVDNDTGEELSRVFQRVAPSLIKRNKVYLCYMLDSLLHRFSREDWKRVQIRFQSPLVNLILEYLFLE